MKKLIKYLFINYYCGVLPYTTIQDIRTPIRIKNVGKIIETMILNDLNVLMNFLYKTALNCLEKEYLHSKFGSTNYG